MIRSHDRRLPHSGGRAGVLQILGQFAAGRSWSPPLPRGPKGCGPICPGLLLLQPSEASDSEKHPMGKV